VSEYNIWYGDRATPIDTIGADSLGEALCKAQNKMGVEKIPSSNPENKNKEVENEESK